MTFRPKRIAAPAIIADAASALYAQCDAMQDAKLKGLAINAITKAFTQLMDGVRFDKDEATGDFIFPSRSRSGLAHRVNGTCDCEAAEEKRPCWHRAARRLIEMIEQHEWDTLVQPPPADDDQRTAKPGKAIIYDEETSDYTMYYDGAYIGSRATYSQAEQDLNAHVYALLSKQPRGEG